MLVDSAPEDYQFCQCCIDMNALSHNDPALTQTAVPRYEACAAGTGTVNVRNVDVHLILIINERQGAAEMKLPLGSDRKTMGENLN